MKPPIPLTVSGTTEIHSYACGHCGAGYVLKRSAAACCIAGVCRCGSIHARGEKCPTRKRPIVLIVDDDVNALSQTSRTLKRYRWDTELAIGIDSARSKLEMLPDVVLLDWSPMGPALLPIIKEMGIPVVIFTSTPSMAPRGERVIIKPSKGEIVHEALVHELEFTR